ncbi:MAG: bifunctional hydroxymethylpyrimidine kinase/phosphomethylpyrimidine kinase [Kiritimatiellae bacterium]|jgi:hydroxymethylpyrimidine/phosphomethylpyrimidine kinase|nr:bifunctional hydroxymethylpyrimidine kinase/phosphomethylpyrimidine kinase [Kiritimatiellia bacterium]
MIPVMTIAGSDSGGGAGVQADLKTFESIGVFGTSAITCVTAQNPDEVTGIESISVELIQKQILTVVNSFDVAAIKTGMLFSQEIICGVAGVLKRLNNAAIVLDPVMIATSGSNLLQDSAVEALKHELLPLAKVITPNIPEAEVLLQRDIKGLAEARMAVEELSHMFSIDVVLKGGHLEEGKDVYDLLFCENRLHEYVLPKVKVDENHGTGCTFAAALTAYLALGNNLPDAVKKSKEFVTNALKYAVKMGKHQPLNWSHGC